MGVCGEKGREDGEGGVVGGVVGGFKHKHGSKA